MNQWWELKCAKCAAIQLHLATFVSQQDLELYDSKVMEFVQQMMGVGNMNHTLIIHHDCAGCIAMDECMKQQSELLLAIFKAENPVLAEVRRTLYTQYCSCKNHSSK